MQPPELTFIVRYKPLNVVLTGLRSDAHTWNLVFLQLLFEDLGHRVINLGPCVSQDEVVESCCRFKPDLLAVSSVNGHGFHDGARLIRAVRDHRQLAGLPTVIGGKLDVVGAKDEAANCRRLLRAGFDAVFPDAEGLAPFKRFVAAVAAGHPPAGLEGRQEATG